jgi:solute carrier family 26, other
MFFSNFVFALKTLVDVVGRIGETNVYCLMLSAFSIIYLIFFKEFINKRLKKRFKFDFPSELILIISMTLLSYYLDFKTKIGITILEKVPSGFPQPKLPNLFFWPSMLKDAFILALVTNSISISLSKLFARKNKYKVDANQEMYAIGFSNIFGSFFSCFPVGASLTRSSLLHATGAKTQLASFISSLFMFVIIIWLCPYFETLPKFCLACIIYVALKGILFQIKDFYKLYKVNKYESVITLRF